MEFNDYNLRSYQLAAIRYFRDMGFFNDVSQASDEEVLRVIRDFYGELDFRELIEDAVGRADADQILLLPDKARVWGRDLEGVYPGENAYVEDLLLWASISRGVFTPTNIHEDWSTSDDSVLVKFTFQDIEHVFVHHSKRSDMMDLTILQLVNSLIGDTPYRFEASDDSLADCRFVVMLTAKEKSKLMLERSWTFCESISDV